MKKILRTWLPFAVVISIVCALIYVVTQQGIRLSYNWPQVDAVNEISAQIKGGVSVDTIVKQHTLRAPIDQTDSLFVIFYDQNGSVIKGGGDLGSTPPRIPYGVLLSSDAAPSVKNITWAPQSDVRIATSVQKINQNNATLYIVAGRNLNQPEQLTSYILLMVGLGWLGAMCISLGFIVLLEPKARERLYRRSYKPRS